MTQTEIQKEIEALKLNTAIITDPQTKDIFNSLLNLIEKLYSENEQYKEANQILKDEINRLKGEDGKPDIKKRNRDQGNSDHSSEKERNERGKDEEKKGRKREAKLPKVTIDREMICPVDT
jgi:cell division protein FtsB